MTRLGKSIVLFFPFSAMILCLIFVHFFWQPDGLMGFVPPKKVFYLHFDLNAVRRSGKIGGEKLGSEKVRVLARKLLAGNKSLSPMEIILENRESFDEIGIVGLENPGQQKKIDLIFLLKMKKWTKLPLLGELPGFMTEEIAKRVTMILPENVSAREHAADNPMKILKNKFSFSRNFLSPWLKGYFYLNRTDHYAGSELRAECFSLPGLTDLFFFLEAVSLGDVFEVPRLTNIKTREEQGYVLVFFGRDSRETFEDRIKTRMAFEDPSEKTVFLPDGTSFIETEVDPDVYSFIDKAEDDRMIRKLVFAQRNIPDVFSFQDGDYFYISNQSYLFGAIRGLIDFSGRQEDLNRGAYFFINNRGIRDLTIVETAGALEGILRF